MDKRLERILPRVQKPARYVGGEYNAVKKDPAQVDTRIAFCFPDTYEIGMSNLGMRILYGVMNNMDGVWCQRVFAPWGDMEEEMRRAGMPLFALESGEPITDFDIVAFSVGYEMAFPAILNMLDLAGIPIHSAERTGLTPLVIAGGTAMYNAEPIADFIDLVSLGEGEDITVELVELHRKARREGWSKTQFLRAAAQLPGIYVPSLYEVTYHDDGTVAEILPGLAVIDCGGVGYACMTTNNTLSQLKKGEKKKLYTYLNVGESIFDLYGFATQNELNSFKLLLGVSGVGPKAALAILSANTPEGLAMAIVTEDAKSLTAAQGIGKKIAQRIILELKDKMAKETASGLDFSGGKGAAVPAVFTSKATEAAAALAVLGYSTQEVQMALKGVDVENLPLEEIIRQGLKKMVK